MGFVTYGSIPVNDQLITAFQASGLYGLNQVGPTWHGNGQRPPQSIPTGITSPVMASSATPSTAFTQSTTSGNGTMLLLVAGVMLIVGLLGLRFIHWRR